MKTVDELIALADAYAHCYAFVGDDSMPIARAALLTALQEALPETWIDDGGNEFLIERPAQPSQPDEFATRGELAARLKCWHRLTREESDELVDLLRAQPVAQPLKDDQIVAFGHRIASTYAHRSEPTKHSYGFLRHTLIDFARAIEKSHGIGARLEEGV